MVPGKKTATFNLRRITLNKLKAHCKKKELFNMSQFVDMAINEKLKRESK